MEGLICPLTITSHSLRRYRPITLVACYPALAANHCIMFILFRQILTQTYSIFIVLCSNAFPWDRI